MANVVEIVVQGSDRSGPAMTSALNNAKRVSAEVKGMGVAFSQAGNIAEQFGQSKLATAIGAIDNTVLGIASLTKELGKSQTAMIAFGAAGAALGASLSGAIYDAIAEKGKKLRDDEIDFLQMVADAQDATLQAKDAEYAAYVKINQKIDQQAEKLLRMKNISAQQFIQGADALNAQREANRVKYVKTADDEIARNRQTADEAYAKAQELIAQNAAKMKEEQFQKYLENLDAQIQAEIDAKKQIRDQANADADAAEEQWARENTGRIEQMRVTEQLINNSLLNLGQALRSFSAQAAISISEGVGNAVAAIATGALSAKEAFKQLGKEMIGMLAKTAAQLVVNAILAQALQSSFAVTSAAIGTAVASAWAPAAAMVSLASYGANSIPASAGIIATTTLAQSLAVLGPRAHSGLDNVPEEATYKLQKGEMVLDPGTSEEVRNAAINNIGGGGGLTAVYVYIDGEQLFKAVGRASRDGRLVISARGVV